MTKKEVDHDHDDSGETGPGGQGGGAAAGDDAGSCVSFLLSWRLVIVRMQHRLAQPRQGRIDIDVVKTMVKTNVQMIMTTTIPTDATQACPRRGGADRHYDPVCRGAGGPDQASQEGRSSPPPSSF